MKQGTDSHGINPQGIDPQGISPHGFDPQGISMALTHRALTGNWPTWHVTGCWSTRHWPMGHEIGHWPSNCKSTLLVGSMSLTLALWDDSLFRSLHRTYNKLEFILCNNMDNNSHNKCILFAEIIYFRSCFAFVKNHDLKFLINLSVSRELGCSIHNVV